MSLLSPEDLKLVSERSAKIVDSFKGKSIEKKVLDELMRKASHLII